MSDEDAPRVPDDWFVGFHRGLAARFWRVAGATMADDDARLVCELLALPRRLVLETLTVAEALLVGGIKPLAEREFGGVRMTARNVYRAGESRLESDYVFEDESGAVETARAAHHVHTTGELVRMLRAAGFTEVDLRGPDGTRPYELGAPRLIVVAVA